MFEIQLFKRVVIYLIFLNEIFFDFSTSLVIGNFLILVLSFLVEGKSLLFEFNETSAYTVLKMQCLIGMNYVRQSLLSFFPFKEFDKNNPIC